MVNRDLDLIDMLVAGVLAASIVLWAFIWAEPYPHPDLWQFMSVFGGRIPLTVLSVLGKVGLGLFAAFGYLVMRGAWIRFRDIEDDELPDKFFFTRFCPLCGAAVFALSPYAWRSAQFLSPDFALLILALFGMFLWQRGCGYRHLTLSSAAYLVLAFVSGVHPLGFVAIVYVSICDMLRRWQDRQECGQREDDAVARRRRSTELILTILFGLIGFGLSIRVASVYFAGGEVSKGIFATIVIWWRDWFAALLGITSSLKVLMLIVGIGIAAVTLAMGRRLRAYGPSAFGLATTLASILGVVTLVFALRAVDLEECSRLAMLRDYVRIVLEDSAGVEWLFTDGRLDDALKFEIKRRGLNIRILNALMPPNKLESEYLRAMAPEPGEAEIFAAGGAEVFKAWARERPDRLATAAWQLGSVVVRRFGKTSPKTCGSVMRADGNEMRKKCTEADRRFVQMTHELQSMLEHSSPLRSIFGGVDESVGERFDAVLWRTARMANERSEAATRAGNAGLAQAERATMQTLDNANGTLLAQGNVIERLLPTSNLVLTPKEALEVALKRADFMLAQRYAREVLVSSPEDPRALFALGMTQLEAKDYFQASRYMERVLNTMPNEPATLNNLALAYLKLGKLDAAKATAERALKINPNSEPIKKNLADIQKALKH